MTQAGIGWTLLSAGLSGAGFSWTAAESLHFWRLARRRLALGLADPLVASRALLWGLVGVSSTAINFANVAAILAGRNLLQDAPSMIVTASLGLLNAVALWLAFLPPEAWVRWVRGSAPAAPRAAERRPRPLPGSPPPPRLSCAPSRRRSQVVRHGTANP